MQSRDPFADVINQKAKMISNMVPLNSESSSNEKPEEVPIGKDANSDETFLGKIPKDYNISGNKKMMQEMVNAGAGAPGVKVLGEAAPLIKEGIHKGLEYLHPEKTAEKFMHELGGGAETTEQNAETTAKRIKLAHDSAKEEALAHKSDVMEKAGKEDIYQLPGNKIETVAKVFTNSKNDFTPENISALQKALQQYHKTENLEKFISKGEDIFEHEGLGEKQISKLEDMLGKKDSEYLSKGSATDLYDKDLKGLHNTFEKKPTFANADKLQSALGDELGYYQRLSKQGKLDPADRQKLKSLKTARDLLGKDQDNFLKDFSPELKDQYKTFKDKYRENVVPYYSSNTLREITREGKTKGITKGQIAKEFANPDKDAAKIAADIGSAGHGNIMYNALQGAHFSGADELSSAILKAKKLGGYEKYVTPQMEKMAELLHKQSTAKEHAGTLKSIVTGGLMGGIIGHPALGASLALGGKLGKSAINKYLSKMSGK